MFALEIYLLLLVKSFPSASAWLIFLIGYCFCRLILFCHRLKRTEALSYFFVFFFSVLLHTYYFHNISCVGYIPFKKKKARSSICVHTFNQWELYVGKASSDLLWRKSVNVGSSLEWPGTVEQSLPYPGSMFLWSWKQTGIGCKKLISVTDLLCFLKIPHCE